MEVNMTHNLVKHLISTFIIVFSVSFAGLSVAHGDRNGDRHGDRIATKWMIEDAINVFNVDAPANPPLAYVKKRFMAHTSLPVRHAEHYVVEQVVTTTSLPPRDPSTLQPGMPPLPPAGPVTSYVMLDESMSLKDLGIVDGDTLRIREIADHDLSAPHNERGFHARDRHHHDGEHHEGRHHR